MSYDLTFMWIIIYLDSYEKDRRSHRLTVRTPASHAGNTGSNPVGITIKSITYKPYPMPFGELTAPQTAFHFFETLFGMRLFVGFNSMTFAFSRERSSRASRTLSMPMLFKYRSVVPALLCRKIDWITATSYPSLYRIDAVRCRIE